MEDKFEHIHYATASRLAQMLEPYARNEPYDIKKELIMEICRRLRISDKKPIPFNNEAFE